MRRKQKQLLLLVAGMLLIFLVGTAVLAQTSAGFNLEWHVMKNGGGKSSSASYIVNGTIGQSISRPAESNPANQIVSSGYWYVDSKKDIYLPMIIKN